MSNVPVYLDKPAFPVERRHHVRRQLSSLAYLDIGTDNGGIALNLSEEGMGFQAVAPLDSQNSVSLRIQVPHSRVRVEIAAQIIWLSDSHRQAGVRFVEIPSESRAQIQEWVRSQILPNEPSGGTPGGGEVASEPQWKQETIREPRKNKWLSLMTQLRVEEPAGQTPPQKVETTEKHSHRPGERETAATSPAPGNASGSLGESGKQPYAVPWPEETPPQATPCQPPKERPKSVPDGQPNRPKNGDAAIVVLSSERTDSKAVSNWRIPASLTLPPTAPVPSTPPPASAEPPASFLDSKADASSPVFVNTISAILSATKRNRARKWAQVAVLFALSTVLCFGIVIWVRSQGTQIPSVETPTQPSAPEPVAKSDTSGSNGLKANELASAVPNKARAKQAERSSTAENQKRKLILPTSSPTVLPVQQEVQPTSTKQSLTPLAASKPPESSSLVMPAPVDSAAAVPAPRIVAGRVLRPTDRFNPCHLSYRVDPAYPTEAQQQRIEGVVKLHQVIRADGSVQTVKLISGPPVLAPAALEAAKYWRYFPALLNGQPIETEQDIEIDFRLPH